MGISHVREFDFNKWTNLKRIKMVCNDTVSQVIEHHKILVKIASVIISGDELNMLGIWLEREPNDIRRLRNTNASIRDAAYQILCSFYDSVPDAQRWGILSQTLKELNKDSTLKELKLEQLHLKAQSPE